MYKNGDLNYNGTTDD